MRDDLHEASNLRLFKMLPKDQCERVFGSELCDIEPGFLGFVGIYDRLAQIVPYEWDVIDLGCAYAPQSWFFKDHKSYSGVDLGPINRRFHAENTHHYHMPIEEFIATRLDKFDQQSTFAICSYVPPWHGDNIKLVRDAFQNVFTYYPARVSSIAIKKMLESV